MNIDLNDPKVLILLQKGLQKVQEERASGVNPPHKGGFIAKKDASGKVVGTSFKLVFDVADFDTLLCYDVRRGRAANKPANETDTFPVYAYYDAAYTPVESDTYKKRQYKVMVRITAGEISVSDAKAAGISVYSALKAENPAVKGVASALMFLRNPDEFSELASSLKEEEEEDDSEEGEEEESE